MKQAEGDRSEREFMSVIATPDVLTLGEAASIIRCSKAHLQNVLSGRVDNVPPLPCVRVGRRILIRRESLERWMVAIESQTGAEA